MARYLDLGGADDLNQVCWSRGASKTCRAGGPSTIHYTWQPYCVLKFTIWDTEVQLSEKPAGFTLCTLYQAAGKGSVYKIISKALKFWNLCTSSWIRIFFRYFLTSCCLVPHAYFCEPGWPRIHLLLFDGVLPALVSKRQLIPIQSICWGVWHAAGVLVVKAGAGFLLFDGT